MGRRTSFHIEDTVHDLSCALIGCEGSCDCRLRVACPGPW